MFLFSINFFFDSLRDLVPYGGKAISNEFPIGINSYKLKSKNRKSKCNLFHNDFQKPIFQKSGTKEKIIHH
jgi:hypothetical protein